MFQSKVLFGILCLMLSYSGIQAQEITFVTADQAQTILSEVIVSAEAELKNTAANDRATIVALHTRLSASERMKGLLNGSGDVKSAIISLLESSENAPITSYQYDNHDFISGNKDRSKLINTFLIDLLKA